MIFYSRKTPFLRVSVFYGLGILSTTFIDVNALISNRMLLTVFIILLAFLLDRVKLFGLTILMFCFLSGLINIQQFYASSSCKNCSSLEGDQIEITAIVNNRISINNSQTNIYVPVSLQEISEPNLKELNQLVAVISLSDISRSSFIIGDKVNLKGTLSKIKKNRNAHTFDFQSHMKNKGIEYYLYTQEFERTGGFERSIKRLFHIVQIHCLEILDRYIDNRDAFAIASAMVLGYKENLTVELEETYRQTGAAHIIAVSGLHVDIVGILLFLLIGKFYRFHVYVYIISCVVMIGLLCSYSLIVGNSPSVVRAVCMYSLLFISKMIGKGYSIWNILSVTALTMLIIKPPLLFDIGFQFSFLAVASIVIFFPLLQKINILTYKPISFLFDVLLVSFAVQVLIGPLSIYYFNYFPSSFFIANSFLILFIYFIIFGSITIITSSIFSEHIASLFGKLIENGINLLNTTLAVIQELPYCIMDDLYLSRWDLCIIYGYILLMMNVINNLNMKNIKILGIAVCIHLVLAKSISFITADQAIIYVYEVKNNILLDFMYDKKCYSYSQNKKDNYYITKNNRLANQVEDIYYLNGDYFKDDYLIKNGHFIQFFDQSLLVDYSGDVENTCDFNLVIAKANVNKDAPCIDSRYIVNHRDSILSNIQTHNIYADGPLIININLD